MIKKGFTLIELILVVSIGLAITFLSFQNMLKGQEDKQAKHMGEQIKQIANAANLYITNHYDVISSMNNSSGSLLDPGPRTCYSASSNCVITVKTLVNSGLLPSQYSEKNSFGSGYNIVLKRSGVAPYYNVNGMLMTDTPLIIGNSLRYDILGKAMQEAGIDSGMTKNPTIIDGYNGSWKNSSSDYSIINKSGLLGYQLGYGSSSYSVFLRRDGTLPMTGDLNMDGHNINAAKNITATETIQGNKLISITDATVGKNLNVKGTSLLEGKVTAKDSITAQGKIRSESYFEGKNGGGDGFRIGGSDSNDIEFALYTPNKPLTVWRNGGSSNESRFHVMGTQSISGDLRLQPGGDGTTTGQINASGNITSNRRITAGEFLLINGTAVSGAACATNGLQGRTAQGQLLSCVNLKWKTSDSKDVIFYRYGGGVNRIVPSATHYCAVSSWLKYGNSRKGHFYLTINNGYWQIENAGQSIAVACYAY